MGGALSARPSVSLAKPETRLNRAPETRTVPGRWCFGERKMKVFAGVLSMISTTPELIDSIHAAIVEPRITVKRYLLQRAVDRGEVHAAIDIETLALVSQSMVSYRVLMLQKPIDRAFLISIIDGVIMPAVRR